MRIGQEAMVTMVARFSLSFQLKNATTISAARRFHIDATLAVEQCLRRWCVKRGMATSNGRPATQAQRAAEE